MKKIIFVFSGLALLLASCSEVNVNDPYGSMTVPAKVTVREVVNKSGSSTIFYTLPDDDNLKYVKAVYYPRKNESSEMIASIFTDSLTVDGFDKEGEFTVDLYSVSYGGAQSEPVKVTVTPQKPPYLAVLDNAVMKEAFGGFDLTTSNPENAKLFFSIYRKADDGSYELISNFSTDEAEIFKGIRGLDSDARDYALLIVDHWGNTSDYKVQNLSPYYEIMADKKKFAEVELKGDSPIRNWSAGLGNCIAALWDGNTQAPTTPVCQWINTAGFPSHITFDMGQPYMLSRFEYWPRWSGATNYTQLYKDTDIRVFEMYGAMELNPDTDRELYDANGVLDPYWTLLGRFENKRESGATVNSDSVACSDVEKSNYSTGKSREFFFSDPYPTARYIRIRTLQTWGNTQQCSMNEMNLYGQPR